MAEKDIKYNLMRCPYPDIWFIGGGRCGASEKCRKCDDDPGKNYAKNVKLRFGSGGYKKWLKKI